MAEPHVTPAHERAAMDLLIGAEETDVPKLPEAVFVQKYLPILADTQSGRADLSQWLDVCGNAYRPVDVVRGKEVLFRVPPLLNRYATPGLSKGKPIAEILKLGEAKTRLHPVMGETYLTTALNSKVEHQSANTEQVKIWNDIFSRYGYPLIELKTPLPGDKPKDSDKPLFSEEFDDF